MSYRINPLVLIFYNILIPCILMFVHDKWIPLYFFIVSSLFLLYMKKYKRLCKAIGITILFYLGQQLLMLSNIEVVQFVSMLFMMIVRLMPTYIVALILMYDYQPSEVISALQSIHVPRAFIIALSITLRYIPTFFRELRYINESMRLRGIRFEMKSIVKSFGYFVVPQLFRCLILADELTSAGLCKGIDCTERRTSYYNIRFGIKDALVTVAICLGLVGEMLWVRMS